MRSLLTRRQVLCGASLTALASVLPPRVLAADATRVLLLGDSMIAGGFGLYLEQELRRDGFAVHRRGKSSTGLARPDFFDWHEEARRQVEAHAPEVSVVMFGGNDVQGLYMGDGNWVRWPDEGWRDEYARRVATLCEILAPDGQWIYWVGMPVMRPPRFHARMRRVNTIFRAEMAIRKHATFIDTWRVLSDGHGEYAHRIPLVVGHGDDGEPLRRNVRVRAGDGIHLSPAGAHVLKAHVLKVVRADPRRPT